MAATTFKSISQWSGKGLYVENESRGFKNHVDEPPSLGGEDKASNPVELLLNSLGGCVSICVAAFAPAVGVEIKDIRVDVEGDLDPDGFLGKNPDVRTGFSEIRYELHIDSPSPQEKIDALVTLVKERCPVSDTLKGVTVHPRYAAPTVA